MPAWEKPDLSPGNLSPPYGRIGIFVRAKNAVFRGVFGVVLAVVVWLRAAVRGEGLGLWWAGYGTGARVRVGAVDPAVVVSSGSVRYQMIFNTHKFIYIIIYIYITDNAFPFV